MAQSANDGLKIIYPKTEAQVFICLRLALCQRVNFQDGGANGGGVVAGRLAMPVVFKRKAQQAVEFRQLLRCAGAYNQ